MAVNGIQWDPVFFPVRSELIAPSSVVQKAPAYRLLEVLSKMLSCSHYPIDFIRTSLYLFTILNIKRYKMPASPSAPSQSELPIGIRLRRIRRGNDLSQRQLGRQAGVSNATISQIESGRLNPTVGMLKKVLDGIPFSLADFFTFEDILSSKQVFFQEEELIRISDGNVVMEQIGGRLSGKQIQLMRETYQPEAHTGKHSLRHEGEECGIVLSGRLTVTVGKETRTLGAGESYYFDSSQPHHFRNDGHNICRVISACTPPSF